jgi:hypothetical protein
MIIRLRLNPLSVDDAPKNEPETDTTVCRQSSEKSCKRCGNLEERRFSPGRRILRSPLESRSEFYHGC